MAERLEFLSPKTDTSPPANQNQDATLKSDAPKTDTPAGIQLDAKNPDSGEGEKSKRLEWLSPTEQKIKRAVPSPHNPDTILVTDPNTGIKTILGKAAEEDKIVWEREIHQMRIAAGHLPDVDYDKGTDFSDKMCLSMMDKDAERRSYLSDRYGAKNVFQDPAGTFYITKNGKKIAPTGASFMEDMAAGVLGHGESLALMGEGAAVGRVAGIPGSIIGAMVGALGGKAFEELEKNIAGVSRKSPEETLKSYGENAAAAGLGELVGSPFASSITRALEGGVPRAISGATPETERLTAQTLGIGGVPPIRSALPDMKATQFHQSYGEKLTGDLKESRNLKAIEGEMRNILKSSGMSEDQIPEAMKNILNTSEAPSYAALGDSVKAHAVQYQEQMTKAVNDLTMNMNKQLDASFSEIEKATNSKLAGDPDFSQKIAESIAQNRRQFSADAERLYGQIDNLVGDTPVVPTSRIQNTAKRIYHELPKTKGTPAESTWEGPYGLNEKITPEKAGTPIFGDPRVLKALADIQNLEGKISFSDAQRIRSSLGELGRMDDLTPGVSKKDFNDLRTAIDESFDLATEGQTPQAVALMRKADEFYKEGIRKFEDTSINQLVASMRTGIYPDSSKIVSTIFQKGQSQRAQEVLKMLPEDLRNKVKGEYAVDLIAQATDKTTGTVSGVSLNRVLAGKQDVLEAAFGPKTAKDIYTYARQLAMRDGKVPVASLDKDRISESIRAAQKAQESLDKFMDDNYLSELAKPSMAPETVYKHLVQPGKETELARAIQFFGPKSPQVQKLRETALTDLMHKAVISTDSGAGKTVGADGLEKALSLYTAKQKSLLFPNGLDKDIETLAENAKFLFPAADKDTMAGGLKAGVVKGGLPFTAPLYITGAAWNYILSRPLTVRYLALGLNSKGPARDVALETLRGTFRASALGLLPDVDQNAKK